MSALRILHVFSTFAPGGPQVRSVELMNHLGPDFEHSICAMDNVTSAAPRIRPNVRFEILPALPKSVPGVLRSAPGLFRRTRPDLLITYNWGAIDVALAAALHRPCPLLHAEDGFGADEANGLKSRRVWARRIVLKAAHGIVVPSHTLERIALDRYKLPRSRIIYLANGVDIETFAPHQDPSAKARFALPPESFVIGSVGHLRAEKDYPNLIRAFARIADPRARLMLVGDGPCREDLASLSKTLGCADRIRFAGLLNETATTYQAMDLFVLSSTTEQMPVALLEAMASGLPAVCTDVGDCASMLDRTAPPFVVPPSQPQALTNAIQVLMEDHELRRAAAAANRRICVSRFNKETMIEKYRRLYLSTAGRLPGGLAEL